MPSSAKEAAEGKGSLADELKESPAMQREEKKKGIEKHPALAKKAAKMRMGK